MIRVVVADDSAVAREMLLRLLKEDGGITVVGCAQHGEEALALLRNHKPDVLLTDLDMPVMNGLELTRTVMRECPLPILVVTASQAVKSGEGVFELLSAGALEVLAKPRDDRGGRELARRVHTLAGIPVFRRRVPAQPQSARLGGEVRVVAIGASTGGPQTLEIICAGLHRYTPPVVLVQHIATGFTHELGRWLQGHSEARVVVLEEGGIVPQAGHLYLAPENRHLVFDSQSRLQLSQDPPRGGHRPSADALFESVATQYGPRALGILLSGMGRDGADGLFKMQTAGARTIAQEASSCVVYGMPRAAVEQGSAGESLTPSQIRDLLAALRV